MLDRLREFERLMQEMARSESEPAREPLERLRSLSSRIISLFDGSGMERFPGDAGGDGYSLPPEALYREVQNQALHYGGLVSETASGRDGCRDLPESVKRIYLALMEDVQTGYEHYLAAYGELEEALMTGDISHCCLAEEQGEQGAALIRTASEVIEEIRGRVPVVV